MDPTTTAINRLFLALDQYGQLSMRGESERKTAAVRAVGASVAALGKVAGQPAVRVLDQAPPRTAGVAMAQALFSLPHVCRTLAVQSTQSDVFAFSPEPELAAALGLSLWELEEIRDDIDRRAAMVLKQSRAMNWLWVRFQEVEDRTKAMWSALFPGLDNVEPETFIRKGSRLYAVVKQANPPPLESLFMPWLPGRDQWTFPPDSSFSARYVDEGLLRAMARSIGSDTEEIVELLDRMVCVIPAGQEHAFVERDRWRSEGWSTFTGLGAAAAETDWVSWPVETDGISPEGWLQRGARGPTLHNARRTFDRHSLGRVSAMMHGIYAELSARVLSGTAIQSDNQAAIFDLGPYIQRVLQPVLDWAGREDVVRWLCQRLDAQPSQVSHLLNHARGEWLTAAQQSWGGIPSETEPYTVQGLLAAHLAVIQTSLYRFWQMTPDYRSTHHRTVLLFFAHYHKNTPISRLWKPVNGRLPPPDDGLRQYFWGTWQRVLAVQEF